MKRYNDLWLPDSVYARLSKGIGLCDVSDGDVLTVDSTAPGGSGTVEGQTKFSWLPPSGGGGAAVNIQYSLVNLAGTGFGTIDNGAGNQTVGSAYYMLEDSVIDGVRVYWKRNASDRTLNLAIWTFSTATTGTQVANVDVAVTASGVYSGTFGSPVPITAGTRIMITMWEKTGAEYTAGQASGVITFDKCIPGFSTQPCCLIGSNVVYMAGRAGGANAFPDAPISALGNVYVPAEPIFAA